jgi:hypothetical protein
VSSLEEGLCYSLNEGGLFYSLNEEGLCYSLICLLSED